MFLAARLLSRIFMYTQMMHFHTEELSWSSEVQDQFRHIKPQAETRCDAEGIKVLLNSYWNLLKNSL